jgi:hypothetical protein
MITEKGVLHTEVIFNDNKTERFLLKKVWDESKPIVSLVMLNPSSSNALTIDFTTLYAMSNLCNIGYGGLEVTNLTSKITTKLDTKNDIALSAENVEYILKSAEVSDKVILCWGKCGENNKKISALQKKLLDKLTPYEGKLFEIANEKGEHGFHPLAPQIRFHWELIPFVRPEYLQEKTEESLTESAGNEPQETSQGNSEKPQRGRRPKKYEQSTQVTSEATPA